MEALVELCDLIAKNPEQFADKLAWICGGCPQPESLLSGSPRVSRSQLNAVLIVARFLSMCPDSTDNRVKSVLFEFLRAIPASFHRSFWPQSYSMEAIASFYADFLGYISASGEVSSDFATEVSEISGEVIMAAINGNDANVNNMGIIKAFLSALSLNFPPILSSDAERLITCLLEQLPPSVPVSPKEQIPLNSSEAPASQTSPFSVSNGGSVYWKSGVDQLGNASYGFNDGSAAIKQQVALFEEETVESMVKQEIAFKLIAHILHVVHIDKKLLEQVRLIAKKQLQSMCVFLKIRKRDWSEQGPLLKARINSKLLLYQAASRMKVKSLPSLDVDGKTSKRLVQGTLSLLLEAAKSCLCSVWRKLRVCEELFGCLLSGIVQIAITRGGQALRLLLIHLKSLVLKLCEQGDTWGSSPGAMYESVLKTCCQIIESGWAKDRAPVDTFILGLCTSIRERNDFDEQVDKDKQTTAAVQLNVIRLLADLNVAICKPEVLDMILPLFIEILEEGDGAIPCILRLRLLDAISRMASLGFEDRKSVV